MTDREPDNMDAVDALFAAARADTPEVPDHLMQRVLLDAQAVQPRPVEVERPTFLSQLIEMIGGRVGAGGLIAATLAGVWLGFAPPAAVENMSAALLGTSETISLSPDVDDLLAGVLDNG